MHFAFTKYLYYIVYRSPQTMHNIEYRLIVLIKYCEKYLFKNKIWIFGFFNYPIIEY